MPSVPKHGRDHCPGGEDPIPCLLGELPWVRRRLTALQSFVSSGETTVVWDSTSNYYTDVFQTTGTIEVRALQDGLYGVSVRLFWQGWPNAHLGIINGVDPDAWGGYSIVNSNALSQIASSTGYGEFRLNENRAISLGIHHVFGSARNLDVGTYIEVRRLGDITLQDRASIL